MKKYPHIEIKHRSTAGTGSFVIDGIDLSNKITNVEQVHTERDGSPLGVTVTFLADSIDVHYPEPEIGEGCTFQYRGIARKWVRTVEGDQRGKGPTTAEVAEANMQGDPA